MHLANKNLNYNGAVYNKGSEVKEGSPGFQELKKAGHLDEVEGKGAAPAASEPEAAPEPEAQAEDEEKPRSKKRR